jgi:ubiquinone/menaquinone biosynthesis C-methylase UbiE
MRRTIKTTRWNTIYDSEPTSGIPRMVFGHCLAKDYVRYANRILDVGCGTGSYTNIVDREGCIGVDLDINALKVAKKYCKDSEFIVSSALNLPFRDGIFEVIFMWEVFEEIPVQAEPQVTYEINRLLIRNGVFFVSFADSNVLSNMLDPGFIFRRFRHYDTDKFVRLASETGLRVIICTIRGSTYTIVSNFLVYFYKHILHRKRGKVKQFFDNKSSEELTGKKEGIVYTFIAARKESK